jgi:hypothetical protein
MIKWTISALLVAGLPFASAMAEPSKYTTPEAAVTAVIQGLEAADKAAVLTVFGPEAKDILLTGEKARDRQVWGEFLEAYKTLNRVAVDSSGEQATLYIGHGQWPFPIRLEKQEDGTWAFNTDAAREEIRLRRIGRNEIDVTELMLAYVDIQADYRLTDHDDDSVMEFAASIISSPGKRDGLYWEAGEDDEQSPIGSFMAAATAKGYKFADGEYEPEPYLGYFYKILTKQGPNAPGGELSYIINGHMVAGHALLAYPAAYEDTGVISFLIGESGVLYEADLGPDTAAIAGKIDAFDPDDRWYVLE